MRDYEILHEEITRRLDMIIKNTNKPPTIYSSPEKIEAAGYYFTQDETINKLNEVIEKVNFIMEVMNGWRR